MRASQQGIDAFACEVDVDSQSDDRGILGLDSAIAAGPTSVRIAFRMNAASVGRAQLEGIASWAVDHCPVADATRRAVPINVEVDTSAT